MSTRDAPAVDRLYTIGEGGRRNFLRPAATKGRFTSLRTLIGIALIVLLVALPFIELRGYPAIWLDVSGRRFHLFGLTLGPTDSYLLFFLLTSVGFSLVVASALWGRVWCGYACPQTVFLEQLYRRVERAIEGSRDEQLKLDKAPWSVNKVARKTAKQAAFVAISFALAHLMLCYFVSPKELFRLMGAGPSAEPAIFVWAVALTAVLYFNFAWFREQLCIIICPYGRLQSALSDRDTVVVGYDSKRGEPRGKPAADVKAGDCVDCFRCVAVCPTGIDIRQGLQLECVGCAACIDACDDVMFKLHRERGLIRYDSQRSFDGEKRRFLRPRVLIYAAFALAGIVAFSATAVARRPFAATIVRQAGLPYVIDGEVIRNAFVLVAHNPGNDASTLSLTVDLPAGVKTNLASKTLTLAAGEDLREPLFLEAPRTQGPFDFVVHVRDAAGRETLLQARFVAPAANANVAPAANANVAPAANVNVAPAANANVAPATER